MARRMKRLCLRHELIAFFLLPAQSGKRLEVAASKASPEQLLLHEEATPIWTEPKPIPADNVS